MKKKVERINSSASVSRVLYEVDENIKARMLNQIGLNMGDILLKITMNYQLGLEKLKMNIV